MDILEEIAEFTTTKKNINLAKILEIQAKEQLQEMSVENEDDNLFAVDPFQPQWPKFINSPQFYSRKIVIEEKFTENNNEKIRKIILDSSLSKKRNAVMQRLAKFKENLLAQEPNCYVGRLLRYQVATQDQKQIKDFYFEFEDQSLQKEIKQIKYYSDDPIFLFSGQIIAAVFDTLSNKDLEIQKLLNFDFPGEPLDQDDFQRYNFMQQTRKDSISIVIAAGPFDTLGNFGFKGLFKLVEKIKKNQISCDVLLLLGPILDQENQKDIDKYEYEYEEYFALLIQALIDEIPKRIKVVIVNSTSEITSVHPVPQPSISLKVEQSQNNKRVPYENLSFVGNPSVLDIDELELGIINEDVLTEINQQSAKLGHHQNLDRIGPLCQQLIQQRSFVPVFPTKFPTDWSKQECLDFDQCPNVIVVPSKFTQFARKIDQTLFINPTSFCTQNRFVVLTYNGNNSLQVIHKLRVDFEKI